MTALPPELLDAVAHGAHHDPHSVLGVHESADGWVIRTRRPLAKEVVAEREDGTTVELTHTRSGIWEGVVDEAPGAYRVRATYDGGADHVADDPYRHLPSLGELDLHLISEGRHEELWRVLGAHVRELDGSTGTAFTVWAPDARAVRVIGDQEVAKDVPRAPVPLRYPTAARILPGLLPRPSCLHSRPDDCR